MSSGKKNSNSTSKFQSHFTKGLEKRDLKKSFANENYSASRVKQTIRKDNTLQLILERGEGEIYDQVLSFSLPQRKLSTAFPESMATPNLNSLVAKLGSRSDLSDSIFRKIQHLVEVSLKGNKSETTSLNRDIHSNDTKMNFLPSLYVSDLN